MMIQDACFRLLCVHYKLTVPGLHVGPRSGHPLPRLPTPVGSVGLCCYTCRSAFNTLMLARVAH